MVLPALIILSLAALGTATDLLPVRSLEYVPLPVDSDGKSGDSYIIGEVIANEFDRHVPALSDNLRGELSLLRNDITRQFDSLKQHMDAKLDRMQRDAPEETYQAESKYITQAPDTPGATIRHNLAMAELRRLGAELTNAMNEEVNKLRDEFRTSLDHLREQVHNSSENLATRLENEFVVQSEESTVMLKKVFFLTRNQMGLIQTQLGNITQALYGEEQQSSGVTEQQGTEDQQTTESTSPPQQDSGGLPQHDSNQQHENTAAPEPLTDQYPTPTSATGSTTALPSTTSEPLVLPRDCLDAFLGGRNQSGVTAIRPTGDMEPKQVWCEQEKFGGGWTVMLWRKKQDVQLDFRKSWDTYAQGFGEPGEEQWIGLETLYRLTKGNPYTLRVDMTWEDESATSLYNYFSVGPSQYGRRGYELNVGGYNMSSTGGDAMEYHNGMDFSTFDEDNDGASGGSCSEWSGGGGWWYHFCFYSNPTGIYPPDDLPPSTQADHILEWRKWQGYYTYLSSLRMMIRPN